jgi:hypothetical protein
VRAFGRIALSPAIERKHAPRIQRVFCPTTAVLVKRSDAIAWLNMLVLGLPVVSLTTGRTACCAGPVFQDGRGSLSARAWPTPSSTDHSAPVPLPLH